MSEDKRSAILAAAAHWVAEEGLSARTAKIAKSAGVAEGTIFNYFPTKDDLLNELYVALKASLDAMQAGFRQREDRPGRWEMIWNAYVDWSVGNDAKRRALRQLRVSETITPESRKAALGTMEAMAAALFDGPDRTSPARRVTSPRGVRGACRDDHRTDRQESDRPCALPSEGVRELLASDQRGMTFFAPKMSD
ncbi:TetR/AcrR family transcriptional regulator [Azospirillum brasilense]|uniref:TetR/AcrR family transcriptional regulator n=1 Tax=Azospirillum brasilense TaxID=192 RepID=UPI001586E0AF|nr:TetR/AcrR family transcriptional regulator [Azospirillum brasilense]